MNAVEYAAYLKTDHWRELRARKFVACGRVCLKCGSRRMIQVHHVNYRNIYDVQLEDLEVLCRSCHKAVHELPIRPKPKPKQLNVSWFSKKSKRARRLARRIKNRFVRPMGMPYSEYQRIRGRL